MGVSAAARWPAVVSWAALIGMLLVVEQVWGWGHLLAPWGQIAPSAALAALGLLVMSYILRALRLLDYFRLELSGRFVACLKLTLLHNLANNLLPMRAGEVSFPVLMSRYFGMDVARSVAGLFWFRLLDLHAIVLISLSALALAPLSVSLWGQGALALVLLLLPAPFLAYALRGRALSWCEGRGGRLSAKAVQALQALPADGRELWRSFIWTWVNWLVKLAALAWVLAAFLPMPAALAWLGAIGGDLTSVLPVHAPGGFGTYEAGVLAAILPFGLAAAQVVPAAINLHLFLLGSSLLAGALAWLLPAPKAGQTPGT